MMGLYEGQTFHLKTRVVIWMSMDMVPVEYRKLAHMLHLIMWFFQYVTETIFIFNGVIWWIVVLFVWIGLWG